MIITKKAINRRTVLKGIGATVALPFLDAMMPSLTALAQTPAGKIPARLGVVYVPNGIRMEDWTPQGGGTAFEMSPILRPIDRFRDRTLVVTGLTSGNGPQVSGVHARASTKFLTDMPPRFTEGADLQAGISIDQLAAQRFGTETQLASLELALESNEAGTCDVGYACAYTNTIAWRSATTPLPMEHNPRAVFERLFGDVESTDPRARSARIKANRSILDSITDKAAQLRRSLGATDSAQLSEYLEAIRDVERRIALAEEQTDRTLPVIAQPAGIPESFQEHARLMFDLQVLAYQSDLTRVITFMIGREYSGRTYPEIGVPDAHHPTSHHQNDAEKLAKITKINTYHIAQFAYYLDKLAATRDGDGSLLDHMLIMYGAGMSDGNAHSPVNLPILVVGGGGGVRGGRHIRYSGDTPLANLHLTILNRLGIPMEQFADSTAVFNELTELS